MTNLVLWLGLALRPKSFFAEKAKANQYRGANQYTVSLCPNLDKPIDTKKELAKVAGVSR